MAATDTQLQSLFQERFQQVEMPVDPAIWEGISAKLGHGATGVGATSVAASSGSTVTLLGWISAGVLTLAGLVGVSYWMQQDQAQTPVVEQVTEQLDSPKQPTVEQDLLVEGDQQVEQNVSVGTVDPSNASKAQNEQITPSGNSTRSSGEADVISGQETADPEGSHETSAAITPAPVAKVVDLPAATATVAEDPEAGSSSEQGIENSSVDENTHEGGVALENQRVAAPPIDVPEPTDFTSSTMIEIGNVFSPNGDGKNDMFLPKKVPPHQQAIIRVFSSATGDLVFSSDELLPWDGRTSRGVPCLEGHYFYVIELLDEHGRTHTARRTVRLFR